MGKGLELALDYFKSNNPKQYELISDLTTLAGQTHLFDAWDNYKEDDTAKLSQLGNQLEQLDLAYPGGLCSYVKNAQKLLQDSKQGLNPLDGWSPSVPEGEAFTLGSPEYNETEGIGIPLLGKVGFVLVAGGLGERLGYNGTKIGLPVETTTNATYLKHYIDYIKAVEAKYANGKLLPLCIMVSNDTKQPTIELLKANKGFGLKKDQLFLVEQGAGVPALSDNDAKFNMTDPYTVSTKPHGHGDIHALLYRDGIVRKWKKDFDVNYIVLFQDTNGLAFHTLPLMLGVSEKHGFIMNSLCVPRKAKQAIGGVTKLTNATTNQTRTINVEYNQLDPLLRSTKEFATGDVNDDSGFSPFPGNINQLVFQADGYNKILERTQGIMPDFVNPKYKDETKTVFKKPTRLECMMQDFPTVMDEEEGKKAGFTQIGPELCFSPVKNSVPDGVNLQAKGIAAGTAATGEADQYAATRIMLRSLGCNIQDADEADYNGIKVISGPAIVIKSKVAACPGELKKLFPYPEKVKISSRSTLVVTSPGVTIESLDLDGALVVNGGETVRDMIVKNDGWVQVPVKASHPDEKIRMRGFDMDRRGTEYIGGESSTDVSGEDFDILERFGCGNKRKAAYLNQT